MLNLKNLQAVARLRGIRNLRKVKLGDVHERPTVDGFEMTLNGKPAYFEDLEEVRNELAARPIEA
jgi:hypothetical protein